MNIDLESICLLGLILQDGPKDRNLLLAVLTKAPTIPVKINFGANTDYPTFYGYQNDRIPFYLMGKGVISNIPREGYSLRIISSKHLSLMETFINKAGSWDVNKKLNAVANMIKLDNHTNYKNAEVYLLFRDKALEYIREYSKGHLEEISSFLGPELNKVVIELGNSQSEQQAPIDWPKDARVEGSKFIFDENNWVAFRGKDVIRFKIFEVLFNANGHWVSIEDLRLKTDAGDAKRTVRQICDECLSGNSNCHAISIGERTENGKAERRLIYTLSSTA